MKVDVESAREHVVQELRDSDKFLLTTHENPDGDALGSLAAMNAILLQLGKDCVMFMSEEEYPLPYEYQDLPLDGVATSSRRMRASAQSSSWTAETSTGCR